MVFMELFEENSHKHRIFEIISEESELTIQRIHNLLKKRYSITTSYQSTYKVARSLVQKKVLLKNGLKYTLNIKWLLHQKKELDSIIFKKRRIFGCVYQSDSLKVCNLPTLKELDNFIQEHIIFLNKKLNERMTYWKSPHCWWLIGYPIEEEKYIEDYSESKLKAAALITANTSLDKAALKYYRKKREYAHAKITQNEDNEVVQVLGDYVFVCKLPEGVIESLNDFYTKPENEQSISSFLKIINKRAEFEMQIIRNPNLAKMYKLQISGSLKNS